MSDELQGMSKYQRKQLAKARGQWVAPSDRIEGGSVRQMTAPALSKRERLKRARDAAILAAAPKPADGEKPAYVTKRLLGEAFAARVISAADFDLATTAGRSARNSIPYRAILAKVRIWLDRRDRAAAGPKSGADRAAASAARRYNVTEIPPVADPARRSRAERSALRFIRSYCTACRGGFLETPVHAKMRKIVHAMQRCIESGVPYHIRQPRGTGKTSIVKGVVMWAMSTGQRHFVEAIAATGRKATGIVGDVWRCMTLSPAFIADFPEISAFMAKTHGNPRSAPSVMWRGEVVGLQKSSDEFHLPRVEIDGVPSPSSGAVFKAFGFSGAIRGEVEGSARPDLMIFDDLQDRALASSPARVAESVAAIKADFLGGDSHTRISSALMTSTPIKPDDLSDRFASDPFWRTETFRLVKSWPRCFDRTSDEGPWQDFWRLWQHETRIRRRDPHPACNAFYAARRAEMDEGAEVLNPSNFRPNELSAVEHAMILFFSQGPEVFDAEYQMSPHRAEAVIRISPELVLSRVVHGLRAITPPADTVMVCAITDINPSYALTTTVVAFSGYCSATVVDHFIHRVSIAGDANDPAFLAEVYEAVMAVGRKLADRGHDVKSPAFHWGVDAAGNQRPAVLDAGFKLHTTLGFRPIPMVGQAQHRFNPRPNARKVKTAPGRNGTVLCWNQNAADPREWVNFDKDRFQEASHLAWSRPIGAPGGASLFDLWDGERRADHEEFALQVCGERLSAKCPARNRSTGEECHRYEWEQIADRWDYGDTFYGAFALAAFYGLIPSTSPCNATPRPRRKVFIGGKAI